MYGVLPSLPVDEVARKGDRYVSRGELSKMSTIRDYLKSLTSDKLLPVFQSTLEDTVYDVLNNREIPDRTAFNALRDSVQEARAQASAAAASMRRIEKAQADILKRIKKLEK
jgi:hypothetical protein